MAKQRPTLSLAEMEEQLGYDMKSFTSSETMERFYSDLKPVPTNVYERTKDEFEEHKKPTLPGDLTASQSNFTSKETSHDLDVIRVQKRSHPGFYKFTLDIHYGFGFDLHLLLTKDEVLKVESIAKFNSEPAGATPSLLFSLPREIRDRIYVLTLQKGTWELSDGGEYPRLEFVHHVGDPTGFYFPICKAFSTLMVCKRMRQEALPIAFQMTKFLMVDIDDLVKLLLAVGRTGRDNIECLDVVWESRIDAERRWEDISDFEQPLFTLPSLHTGRCVQLMKQCKRLKFLRLRFEEELISKITPLVFQNDLGILELCSIQEIRTVEVRGTDNQPLEQCSLAQWLKAELEIPQDQR